MNRRSYGYLSEEECRVLYVDEKRKEGLKREEAERRMGRERRTLLHRVLRFFGWFDAIR